MIILINLYNQVGAGPRNISLNLIRELCNNSSTGWRFYLIVPNCDDYRLFVSCPGLIFIKLPRYKAIWMKMLYRVYLEFVLIPRFVRAYNVESVLAFGNFLLAPLKIRKIVLLHHSYIFDDIGLKRLPIVAGWLERVKRLVFWLTLRNIDHVVVQSDFVRQKVQSKWSWYRGGLHVIENPVSNRLIAFTDVENELNILARKDSMKEKIELLYVSRYYPHKNHSFLLALSEALHGQGLAHRICITIDPGIPGASKFLNQIAASGLPIINLGEINQCELRQYYANAHLLIFPSGSETFGNPLVEAMGFGLPVVVPDLEYAHAVLADAGLYYAENDADNCASIISSLVRNEDCYEFISHEIRGRFSKFPCADEWLKKYLALL